MRDHFVQAFWHAVSALGMLFLAACNGPQTFESGLAGWTQSQTDDFDWTLDRAGTTSFNTGPTVDHTFGTSLGKGLVLYKGTAPAVSIITGCFENLDKFMRTLVLLLQGIIKCTSAH